MIRFLKDFKTRRLCYWAAGFLAFLWVLLRSGPKPQRITYPCQQATIPVAVNWLLAVTAYLGGSIFLRKFARLSFAPILLAGAVWFSISLPEFSRSGVADIESLPVWEVDDPVSTVFVMDSIPPTIGSLAPGDTTVPDEYLVDPAIDTLLMMLAGRGIFLHQTGTQPDGIVGSDDVVVIKGNFQWNGRNTTSADRIKGLIRQVLQHPDGFSGEILVCDNSQDIGTGINDNDNNSEDRDQSIPDVVRTFYAKGFPVYSLDWNLIWGAVAGEYSEGDYNDGYVYDDYSKISYPKFMTPSGEYYLSLRYGIWDSLSAQYDSSRLSIIDFPVLKEHTLAGATIAVKNWIGVLTTAYADQRYGGFWPMHNNYFWSQYALVARVLEVTYPELVIVDASWTTTDGPHDTVWVEETKMLAASADPVAASWYTAKFILTPISRYPYHSNPDQPNGNYNRSLINWNNYLRNIAGLPCTMDSLEISVFDREIMTGIEDDSEVMRGIFVPARNYPNPFNAYTTIYYSLSQPAHVTIDIFDVIGRKVNTIAKGEEPAGYHQVVWNAIDQPSGIYFYRIKAGNFTNTNKMMLLK
ncbi:MAG: DUF362 domain-containing protein [Candidatus Zixiibacteriota bacterium]|nr:MAG: DUF362 domain-containing protein [candidate division Zixibacteria bacterium]